MAQPLFCTSRRHVLAGLAALPFLPMASKTFARELAAVRIGTGNAGGTYYPIGEAIGSILGNANKTLLSPVAIQTAGSIENLEQLQAGNFELALCQANIAYWSFIGVGPFRRMGSFPKLRAIASLYLEKIHLVVDAGSSIRSLNDIVGKQISFGEENSGTMADAKTVLSAARIPLSQVIMSREKTADSLRMIERGRLDGAFMTSGEPMRALIETKTNLRLIPLDLGDVFARHPFLLPTTIKAGAYPFVSEDTPTLGTAAMLVISQEISDDQVFAFTQAIFSEEGQAILRAKHPQGAKIRIETAQQGLSIPLHAGAKRFYDSVKPKE